MHRGCGLGRHVGTVPIWSESGQAIWDTSYDILNCNLSRVSLLGLTRRGETGKEASLPFLDNWIIGRAEEKGHDMGLSQP